MALALVYLVWAPLVLVGLVAAFDRLGHQYMPVDRDRRPTRKERRQAAGIKFLQSQQAPPRRPRTALTVPRIARQSIDQVQATADLVEIVGHYTQLKKSGANFMGRCPFHEEKTASFSVNPAEKLYYCFGCGEGGNLFSFVQRKENLDFAQAVEYLADKYGIVLEYEESSARGEAERHRRDRLRALLEQATAYYERVLWDAKAAAAAREYLEGRGLGAEVCRRFRVGFSLAGWERLRDAARRQGFNEQELLDAGLVVPGRRGGVYDRFRARVMFPLADDRGRTLGFGARTLGDEKPKYLNSPETPLYHKSEALFGLHNAKARGGREDRVYVVEGYTDVLALAQAGVENVVASMGTALTEQQLKRLARLSRELFLCFDADAAGVGAMSRALSLARRLGLSLHVVRMPDGSIPPTTSSPGRVATGSASLPPAPRRCYNSTSAWSSRETTSRGRTDGRRPSRSSGGCWPRRPRRSNVTRSFAPRRQAAPLRGERALPAERRGRRRDAGPGRAGHGRRRLARRRRPGRRRGRRRPRARGALPGGLPGAAREGPRGACRRRRGLRSRRPRREPRAAGSRRD